MQVPKEHSFSKTAEDSILNPISLVGEITDTDFDLVGNLVDAWHHYNLVSDITDTDFDLVGDITVWVVSNRCVCWYVVSFKHVKINK